MGIVISRSSRNSTGATARPNTSHLRQKEGKADKKAPIWHTARKQNNKELSMYRLREMEIDDKVCEQVSMTMLSEVYPREVIERCVQHSKPWCTKVRRVRLSTALSLVVFVIALARWSRRNPCQVWHSLVGKLSDMHPAEPKRTISDAGLSGRRKELGSQCLQAILRERCQVIAQPSSMPSAFFGRYRLMAIDGTVFNTSETKANVLAFGRSS